MRASVSVQQTLAAAMSHEVETLDRVIAKVVRRVGERAKILLRRDTSVALGQRMANTWQGIDYPNTDRGPGKAASLVYSKAPLIIDAFDVGATIRPKSGRFLAIPTDNVPRVTVSAAGGARRPKASPEEMQRRGFDLRFVPPGRMGRAGALVVDNTQVGFGRRRSTSGMIKTRRILRPGKGRETVVMYWLIPRAKIPKRLDIETHRRSARDDLLNTMTVELRNAP